MILKMFSAFKHHGAVLGVFNGKMAFKRDTELSDICELLTWLATLTE